MATRTTALTCKTCGAGPFRSLKGVKVHMARMHKSEEENDNVHNNNGHTDDQRPPKKFAKKRRNAKSPTKSESKHVRFCPCCGLDLEKLALVLEAVEGI